MAMACYNSTGWLLMGATAVGEFANCLYVYEEAMWWNVSSSLLLSTDLNVSNNTAATHSWSNLTYNTTYEWYVNISDGADITTSSKWNFTTLISAPNITFNPSADANNTIYARNWSFINVTTSTAHYDTVYLEWNKSANESFQNQSGQNFWSNKTNNTDGTYYFRGLYNTTWGDWFYTDLRTVHLDTTAPFINITSPINASINYNLTEIHLNINATDTRLNDTWWNNGSSGASNLSYSAANNFTVIEGTNTWTAWANDTVGNQNTTNVTFFNFFNPAINPVSITDSLLQGNNKTVNITITTGTLSADYFWYNLTIYGNITNKSLFSNYTLSSTRLLVSNTSNKTVFFYEANTTAPNGTYKSTINVTREYDGYNSQLPITITINALSGNLVAVNTSSTWATTMYNDEIETYVLELNNTGNYNLTNCTTSIKYDPGRNNFAPFVGFNETGFNISVGVKKSIRATATNPSANVYADNYFFVECTATPTGGKDQLPTNEPRISITVNTRPSSPSTGGDGDGGVLSKCDFTLVPKEIMLDYDRTSVKIEFTNGEASTKLFTYRFDDEGNATPFLSIEGAPATIPAGATKEFFISVTDGSAFDLNGTLETDLIISSTDCLTEEYNVSIVQGSALSRRVIASKTALSKAVSWLKSEKIGDTSLVAVLAGGAGILVLGMALTGVAVWLSLFGGIGLTSLATVIYYIYTTGGAI